jgi:ATP-binding cassette subfamily B protein
MLGLLGWWSARAHRESEAYSATIWRERRRVYFTPYLLLSGIVLAGSATALTGLAIAARNLGVLDFTLAIQAMLIPLRFGTYFPECDIGTEFGMVAWDAIAEAESRFRGAREQLARPKPAMRQRVPEPGAPRHGIRFENVSFGYRGGERAVLAGIDLELRAGTSTAVVGLNGAGKTTLVKLLACLYHPQHGRITVDGTPLDELNPQAWQRHLAVIFQDFIRYELDAATNIALGAPHVPVDLDAVRRAAERAGASDVLESLPNGLLTPLSSRLQGGIDLSGGQWQRIALARALYAVEHGAGVLMLDEPTAHLDVRAELAFFDRFLELTHGLTTMVISHRFSTVRRADRIVVLEGGRIREQGTHTALIEKGGRYAELYELQARRFSYSGRGEQS